MGWWGAWPSLGVLLLSIVAPVAYFQLQPLPPPVLRPGKLRIAPRLKNASLAFELGAHRVVWVDDALAVRRANGNDPKNVPAWSTVAGEEFVFAARTSWNVEVSHGHMRASPDRWRSSFCSGQVVVGISQERAGGPVRVHGTLSECAGSPNFVLQLSRTTSKEIDHLVLEVALCDSKYTNASSLAPFCPPPYDPSYTLHVASASLADEAFFGMGAQFSRVNMKGLRVPIFTNEQGVGRGMQPLASMMAIKFRNSLITGQWHSTYTAIPTYITSNHRGLVVNNSHYVVFDLRAPERCLVEVNSSSTMQVILSGDHPLDLVEELSTITGRFAPLPEWAAQGGAIVGLQGGSEVVRNKVAILEHIGTPIIAVWLQDWVGKRHVNGLSRLWWNWEVDADSYRGWRKLIKDLKQSGIATMTYVNPHLTDVSGKSPSPAKRNMYLEAKQKGYLVKHCDGTLAQMSSFGFEVGMVDLTHPEARQWMGDILKSMLAAGVQGWMADFAEALPLDVCLHNNQSGAEAHNAWPVLWAQLNREIIDSSALQDQVWIFTRAAGLTTASYTNMQWLGDQLTSWDKDDGLGSVLAGALSGGFSGLGLTHSDIGGYTSIVVEGFPFFTRTKDKDNAWNTQELFMRWCEFAAFTPIYRTHEGIQPSVNVQFDHDQETLAHFAFFAKIHRAWASYRVKLLNEYYSRGYPMMRHMFMHFPRDATTISITTQYMLGPEILVAPVVEKGAQTIKVYLPAGTWKRVLFHLHVTTQDTHVSHDQWHQVFAPVGLPAVFYREDSLDGQLLQRVITELLQTLL